MDAARVKKPNAIEPSGFYEGKTAPLRLCKNASGN